MFYLAFSNVIIFLLLHWMQQKRWLRPVEEWQVGLSYSFCLVSADLPSETRASVSFPVLLFAVRLFRSMKRRKERIHRGLWWQRCVCKGYRSSQRTAVLSSNSSNRCFTRWVSVSWKGWRLWVKRINCFCFVFLSVHKVHAVIWKENTHVGSRQKYMTLGGCYNLYFTAITISRLAVRI